MCATTALVATLVDVNKAEMVMVMVDGKMPGVRCPRCAEQGIEQFVLSGKRCPKWSVLLYMTYPYQANSKSNHQC